MVHSSLRDPHPVLFIDGVKLDPEILSYLHAALGPSPILRRSYRVKNAVLLQLILPTRTIFSLYSFIRIDGHVYAMGETLGTGGFGSVRLGYDLDSETSVAIKVQEIKPSAMSRVETQAMITRDYGIGEAGHVRGPIHIKSGKKLESFMAIPLATSSLNALIRKNRNLSAYACRRIMYSVCQQVRRLHQGGHTHFDLKPDNVLILDDDAYVSDFGITVRMGTTLGRLKGCHAQHVHCAPELFERNVTVGPALDAWGLGYIFKEMARNEPSVQREFQAIANRLQNLDPDMRPSVETILSELGHRQQM